MPARARPLSPHLQIYRWQIGNTLSILHRLTGLALSAGFLALIYWLAALAGGRGRYAAAMALLAGPLGAILAAAFGLAFFFHLLNGVRHLSWDLGYGFGRRGRHASAWIALAGALALTILAGALSAHFAHFAPLAHR
ncbi:MAG TPA: succinate dehydrogenase, cytochrome b556 subunit [Steroidobacteraceae bacterium]|nr:succinate dehydrogenase, cytochrome b556 subunit [Steroidobacteraceae bacterium]